MNPQLHIVTLANGLRVVICEKRGAPVVNVTVAYKVGSKDESPDHTGLAHLFEHVMFDNIEDNGKGQFDLYLTDAGGASNAYTTYDFTLYYLSLPSSHLELGLWLESQRLSEFRATPQALATQIQVVTEEIKQNVFDQPYGDWRNHLAAHGFAADTMYSWEIYGSHEHVQKTDYATASAWYNEYYRPDNACLILCGDIDTSDAMALVEKYIAPIPARSGTPRRTPYDNSNRRTGSVTLTQPVPSNAVMLGYHADGMCSDRIPTYDILTSILSEGRSSRLYSALQYEQQIASYVGAFMDKREYSSIFTVMCFAMDNSIPCGKMDTALRNEVQRIVTEGITEDELEKAKAKVKTSLALELQTTDGVADALAQLTLFFNDPNRIATHIQKYNSVTTDHVNTLARELFAQEPVQIHIVAENHDEPHDETIADNNAANSGTSSFILE
ncbi:MAG: insulinase family protein [Candidatus Kapabacteria bacterium]|nr:insulinase family protein [Candidatus Kapabacteria bacterium]